MSSAQHQPIDPIKFRFGADQDARMEIVAGPCCVKAEKRPLGIPADPAGQWGRICDLVQ